MCDFFLSVYYSALLYTDIEAPAAAPLNHRDLTTELL